jgi:twitching motility protein PilT
MMLLEAMARGLGRPGVTEFAVMAGRPPSVKVGSSYEPVSDFVPSEADVLEMLVTLGGLPYIDSLGSEPAKWKTVEGGVGTLLVKAARRQGVVQALFVLQPSSGSIPVAPVKGPLPAKGPPPLKAPATPPAVAVGAAPKLGAKPPPLPGQPFPAARVALLDDDDDAVPSSLGGNGAIAFELDVGPELELERNAPLKPPPASVPPKREGPLFDCLLGEARQKNASDLHIVATRPALFRIAGELVPVGPPIDAGEAEEILLATIPARLRAGFDRDGSCDFAVSHSKHGRFRVNISRQRTGLKASLRLIGFEVPSLDSLGLPAAIGNATHHHQGLIVLTGPTGHGKTSTLAALVNLLNTESTHHIITVEDPVEYVHPRKKALISQREVGTQTRSFANALKASLREDPDVIVVGELRDTETVRMALAASETGHLVIATMNTPSAAKTIDRLIDLFPPGDQPQVRMGLAGGLRLIVSQRLVRGADGARVFVAAEVLPGSVALWNLIRENKTYQIPSLQQRGKSLGIVRLDDSLCELVKSGKVSLEEARLCAEAPDELTFAVTGQRPAPPVKGAV